MARLHERLLHVEDLMHRWFVVHGIAVLRIAVGAVFLGFGALKYFPGVSPAEDLVRSTTHILTLGAIPDGVSIVGVATLECFIGACLISGRLMRLAIWLLALQFIGILSPLVLVPGRLFAGPHHAPTLEGQYVLKDVILVAAGVVIAAGTFRGGRLVRGDDLPPESRMLVAAGQEEEQERRQVLEGAAINGASASAANHAASQGWSTKTGVPPRERTSRAPLRARR